jgi:hypothetical protein
MIKQIQTPATAARTKVCFFFCLLIEERSEEATPKRLSIKSVDQRTDNLRDETYLLEKFCLLCE